MRFPEAIFEVISRGVLEEILETSQKLLKPIRTGDFLNTVKQLETSGGALKVFTKKKNLEKFLKGFGEKFLEKKT